MRAVVLEGIGESLVVVNDYPEAGFGRVTGEIIDVVACGVCHSDLHVVDGEFASPLPIVLGHEVTGLHAEMGPVILYAPWGCGRCRQCTQGSEMICANGTEAGLKTDGGYAERVWVPQRRYLAPLGDLDPITAAPLACGGLTAFRAVNHGVETLRSGTGTARVLVIGAGGLGGFAISFLRLLSDANVTVVDPAASKRARARALGAHVAVGPGAEHAPFDVVIDFVGADATIANAAANVAREGLVIVVGLAGGTTGFGLGAVPPESRFMTSIWGTRAELDLLLNLAQREPSILEPVQTLPLVDAQTAHERLRAGEVPGRIVLTT